MRRVVGVAAAWLVLLAVGRTLLLAPEGCSSPSVAELRAASASAVGWFERNQLPDGRFVYAVHRDDGEVERATHLVRHHGVLLSLYQAAAAGHDDALAIADRALEFSLDQLVPADDGAQAIGAPGARVATGASTLLVAALVERRSLTGDRAHDDVLEDVAAFLLGQVEPTGAVRASWDPATGPVPEHSIFFTGETMWALARVASVDPSGPWGAAAERIAAYLALDRDRVEDRLPYFSDHWASYGIDELSAQGARLSDDQVVYARRLAGLFATSAHLESQNSGQGPIRWTRGPSSLAAGVGTLGEGAGALQRLAERDPRLADLSGSLRGVQACVAGLLVDRQVQAADVEDGDDARRVVGAWFRHDRTQEDDQQHALSALLAAEGAAGADVRPRHTDHGGAAGWLVLALTVVVAADPLRIRAVGDGRAQRRSLGALAGLGLLLALVAEPLLDGLDLSEPTVRMAAGLVVLVTALADLWRPGRTGGSVVRPGALLAVMAGAVDPGIGAAVVAVFVAVAIGLLATRFGPLPDTARWSQAVRVVAAVAVVVGLDLLVDGIFEL